MEPFKNIYNKKSISEMSEKIKNKFNDFDSHSFILSSTRGLSQKEMKERVIQISNAIDSHLPGPFKRNILILKGTLHNKRENGLKGFILWPYSHYVETRGIENFDISMEFLTELTKCFTAEWGIRPFLERYPDQTYSFLKQKISDPNEHVRRWISEGTRPNLPWGMKISHSKLNLKKNITLLEELKNDSSLYVRKSVANHLNDISRIDSKLLISTLKKWKKSETKELQWITKHALRSLIKEGHSEALQILGFKTDLKIKIRNFKLNQKEIKEGESIELTFELQNLNSNKESLMIDYIIHYQKSNKKISKKVFKLKIIHTENLQWIKLRKKIDFKKVTTRKHYPGIHTIELQINGKKFNKKTFNLKC